MGPPPKQMQHTPTPIRIAVTAAATTPKMAPRG